MPHDTPSALEVLTADYLATLDEIDSYVPTLTATTTNPNLGSGAVQVGWYRRDGHWITGEARFRWGTSGTSFGSGGYLVGLPYPGDTSLLATSAAAGLGSIIGVGIARDNSASGNSRSVTGWLFSAQAVIMHNDSTGGFVNPTNPFTFANEDGIVLQFSYPADPAALP